MNLSQTQIHQMLAKFIQNNLMLYCAGNTLYCCNIPNHEVGELLDLAIILPNEQFSDQFKILDYEAFLFWLADFKDSTS